VAIGEGFAGTIAATRRELALRDAANDPLVVSDDIRRERLRALYGVPLVADGELVGVAHMGSRTAYEFSEEDLVVFRAAAARVTTLSVETTLRAPSRAPSGRGPTPRASCGSCRGSSRPRWTW
jgi:signal transduction protein with GAF and PtsI domain